MFLSTIGLTTDKAIGTVLSKSGGSRTNDVSDKRGKAEPENKKNGETSGLVNHHYRWSHAPNRLCISPEHNISAMFKDFCSRYEDFKISYVYFNKKIKKNEYQLCEAWKRRVWKMWPSQIKSNQTIYSFTWFLQILVYINKNKMAKYLQWKIICGETNCKETLYKPWPHNAKIKN